MPIAADGLYEMLARQIRSLMLISNEPQCRLRAAQHLPLETWTRAMELMAAQKEQKDSGIRNQDSGLG